MRVFLDANVLFTAAHNPEGKCALIIELGTDGYFEVVTCQLAVEEARRNLELKFPRVLRDFSALVRRIEVVQTVLTGDCPIELPDKDVPIMLSAMQAKSSHLVTGDLRDFGKHMNRPKASAGITILTPSQFLSELP